MTDSAFAANRKYGLIPDQPDARDFCFAFRGKPTDVPETFSSEQHLASTLDQHAIGSCGPNSLAGFLKLLMNKTNYPWPFTPSRLQVYYDTRELEGTIESDSGVMLRDMMKVVNKIGVAPEDSNPEWSWPYSSTDLRWREKPPEAVYKDAALHKCLTYSRVHQDEHSIKQAIVEHGGVIIGISVYESFESKKASETGVIPMPRIWERLLGGHALFLWGYGNHDADHVDGRNSWGPEWGDNGSFHLPWKYLLDHRLCSDIWTVAINT